MAAPFKRICCQTVRQASRYHNAAVYQSALAETTRCQNANSWTPAPVQQRQYTSTPRSLAGHPQRRPNRRRAPTSSQEGDEEELIEEAEEEDPDLEAVINEAEISSTGYAELEQHRELREMVRLAAWEMPLLTALHKPYAKPDMKQLPLRWRYTTYFGESHPASRKVVVEFKVANLSTTLNEQQMVKFRKLVGVRYNPQTDEVKISCESFETQAMNKRYLGDTVQKLIRETKNSEGDTFEDVPLDTRHYKWKTPLKFPEEWKLTDEKRAVLEEGRRILLLEEAKRVEEKMVVSGAAAIEEARKVKLAQVEEPVMVEARQPLPKGKQGRKEMKQTVGANRG